ncbi:SixA phosphatase family protein [Labrys monachus]|uniref:Phosphohistidine phosphatase n=1 Tax=Labrys monachus TaxID=217067 RepID=A0ABU0FKV2_9HYPH|nr:histidine phosphatase family protein [Labrys monachus]MDQ0395151.1 phosphohistidine phosphatase [Labrys monachus]
MRRLILLRHAKSAYPDGVTDHERPLAARGQRDAPVIGKEMARRGLSPDHVVISTARRTRETFNLVEPFLGQHTAHYERAVYEAPIDAILRVIRAIGPEVASLMIIGHNPGLERTASHLVRGGGTAASPLEDKFPTAALAVIDLDVPQWKDVGPHLGTLAMFLTPKQLRNPPDHTVP